MKKVAKFIKFVIAFWGTVLSFGFVVSTIENQMRKGNRKKNMHVPYGNYEKYIKRPLDFSLSLMAIIFVAPILLIVGILVRLKLGSPVLFSQERPGRDEEIFKLYKFRSMTDVRDKDGNLLPDEERLPEFGKRLRSTSLDELPEFFNILVGDMAIVGPRPLLVEYLPRYNSRQARRHEVRPGLTGLAQVRGRNSLSWEEKFEEDIRYVEKITFLGDCSIIIQTIAAVLSRKGITSDASITMERFLGNKKDID